MNNTSTVSFKSIIFILIGFFGYGIIIAAADNPNAILSPLWSWIVGFLFLIFFVFLGSSKR